MLLSLATKIFGTSNQRVLKNLEKHIDQINALDEKYKSLSDEDLQRQTDVLKARLKEGESLDDIMHDAFAVVREAAWRVLGERHYNVQLIGGTALHKGMIAEMKTGEGKTLSSTLPVYLNALEGKGVHVITVNDYLAERDAAWMGQVFNFLGLTVGCITGKIDDNEERKAQYAADITYGTNNEFGFDYLRDNMKYSLDRMVQRDFNYAIIDEVDSILIDEARTPLIISGPSEDSSELYIAMDKVIPRLAEDDFELDEKMRTVTLTDEGTVHAEQLLKEDGLLTEGGLYDAHNIALVHHLNQALKAHKLFRKDEAYIIKDDKVVIIDEFTGRMMEGRRFSEGLHQALEAKEHVSIQSENQTLASITFQNYFRLYPKLAGMTGTAMTEAAEFADIYSLACVEIPTHKPIARIDHNDKIYKTLEEKDDAIIDLIKECYARKQPTLVGTVSIEKSELLSAKLKKEKIPHEVLNARHHEQESQIVAQAGRPGAVTIATNMAGRGTDIKLGGNLEMMIAEEIKENWDDAKKQAKIEELKEKIAQNKEAVKEAGGLYVIGTERHESRRIDNQLRGRSGRQGDPGASAFFLSLEDDLMRIFGAEKMEMLLAHKHIGLQEGESLTHPWISKALERAQARVETQNYEVRKNLLKFDDVMNDQRKVIYEQRREIMDDQEVEELAKDMRYQVITDIVQQCIPPRSYAEQWNVETLKSETLRLLNLDLPIDEWAKEEGIADQEIEERIIDASDKMMAEKVARTGPKIYRQMEKSLLLQRLDQHWKEHLLNLDHLRQGINLRAFGQKDPLNEYKAEAFAMFELMLDQLRESVAQTMSYVEFNLDLDAGKILINRQDAQQSDLQETRQDPAIASAQKSQQNGDNVTPFRHKQQNVAIDPQDPSTWGKVSRNDSCPCGSGKKFKHCHGALV